MKFLRGLGTAVFFFVLSIPWFYGFHLALAQEPQPTPSNPVAQTVQMAESQPVDWCKSVFVTATVVNYVQARTALESNQVKIWLGLFKDPQDGRDLMTNIIIGYKGRQSMLNIAYILCAATPTYVRLVQP